MLLLVIQSCNNSPAPVLKYYKGEYNGKTKYVILYRKYISLRKWSDYYMECTSNKNCKYTSYKKYILSDGLKSCHDIENDSCYRVYDKAMTNYEVSSPTIHGIPVYGKRMISYIADSQGQLKYFVGKSGIDEHSFFVYFDSAYFVKRIMWQDIEAHIIEINHESCPVSQDIITDFIKDTKNWEKQFSSFP